MSAAPDKDALIRKIKKLMALGQSPNQAEAAAAIAKAQALMEAHAISQSTIDLSDIREDTARATVSRKPAQWEGSLALTVSCAFGVEVIFVPKGGSKADWTFYGPGANPEVAAYAFAVLMRKICRLRRDHTGGMKVKRATQIRRGDLFCEGFVRGVRENIRAFAGAEDLKPVLDLYTAHRFGDTNLIKGTDRTNKATYRDLTSVEAGYAEGRKARLHHGVGGAGTSPALIGGGS